MVFHDEALSVTPQSNIPVTRTTDDGRLIVEAGELGWLSLASGSFDMQDRRSASEDGCDPMGCIREYTRVRWLRLESSMGHWTLEA